MVKKILSLFFMFFLLVFYNSISLAYEKEVHKIITENSLNKSDLINSLNKYTGLDINEVIHRLIRGSQDEDNLPRPLNHFYDPLTGKGLTGWANRDSYSWANGSFSLNNIYGFNNALDALERSLTLSSKSDREQSLDYLFYILGHLCHLIQDCAVPAHVRNDPHFPLGDRDPYEKDTLDRKGQLPYDGYDPVSVQDFDKLSRFWDWNKGGAGESAEEIYDYNSKGLAEFTNHNFVSKDTNIEDDSYEYPAQEWLTNGWFYSQPELVKLADGTQKNIVVKYAGWNVEDKYTGNVTPCDYMATYSFFDFYRLQYDFSSGPWFSLNTTVLQKQAEFLIPRAVGYSAGFLNYFFRGQFEVTKADAVKNSTGTYDISIRVKNISFGETDLGGGTLAVYYEKETGTLVKLYEESNIDLDYDTEHPEINLTNKTIAVPSDKTIEDLKFTVVYNGIIGNEEGVIGKVFSPELVQLVYYYTHRQGLTKTGAGITIEEAVSDAPAASVDFHNHSIAGLHLVRAEDDPSTGEEKYFFTIHRGYYSFTTADTCPQGKSVKNMRIKIQCDRNHMLEETGSGFTILLRSVDYTLPFETSAWNLSGNLVSSIESETVNNDEWIDESVNTAFFNNSGMTQFQLVRIDESTIPYNPGRPVDDGIDYTWESAEFVNFGQAILIVELQDQN